MSLLKALPITMIASSLLLGGCQSLETRAPQQDSANNNSMTKTIQPSILADFKWQLMAASDKNNQSLVALDSIKDQVQLSFDIKQNRQRVGFTVGCNGMGADFQLSNNTLKLGNVISTEIYCQDLDQAEKLLGKLMATESKVSIQSGNGSIAPLPILTQQLITGESLRWQGIVTPEARYQQQGDIVFWEVNHEPQTCPTTNLKTCLKVRPVYYDQQGIKQGSGKWELFVDDIEGYEHDSNVDSVLRLKRFTIDPVDVKGKQFVYVLDMIVESSVIP
ncbi:META domain-containing protein [Psychrobacter sanguinis]|uniref:META domain-containing protein n=1 Tax=Psychrobacter sanguinis TaxID=861445 RepID=UPI00020C60BD|nr:META domain-containing protein [Psychrobacter sanguinis]EGK15212.1 hypothetical protein HMPREF9373_0296 [Psychrobacter sp. 1501(2011)]MCD9151313.1 META and DUF4377 domain-containing protein [Psychrobacter sanguinis]